MHATVTQGRQTAELNSELGPWAVFRGRNFLRLVISSWPKVLQQFVGMTVFNTFAVYFCEYVSVERGRSLTNSSPSRRQQESLLSDCHLVLCTTSILDSDCDDNGQSWSTTSLGVSLCSHCHLCSLPWHHRMFQLQVLTARVSAGKSPALIAPPAIFSHRRSGVLCMPCNIFIDWRFCYWLRLCC